MNIDNAMLLFRFVRSFVRSFVRLYFIESSIAYIEGHVAKELRRSRKEAGCDVGCGDGRIWHVAHGLGGRHARTNTDYARLHRAAAETRSAHARPSPALDYSIEKRCYSRNKRSRSGVIWRK